MQKASSRWVIAGLVGAAAMTVGAVVYAKTRDDKTIEQQTGLLTPVTDTATIHYLQNAVASALARGSHKLLPGLTSTDYNQSDVDNNPNNPRWVKVVSTFQAFVNKLLPSIIASGIVTDELPPGFPSTIRTDGVVDQATATLMKGPTLTPSDIFLVEVTDPPRVRALQTWVADELDDQGYANLGLPLNSYLMSDVDGNPKNPKFMRVIAAFQIWFNKMAPTATDIPSDFPRQLRTDGVLDLATSVALEKS